MGAFRGTDVSREEGLRWLWLACRAALVVWDDASFDLLSDRQVTLARDAGALTMLPIAFNMRATAHLYAGEFTPAASLVAQAESVIEATGSSIAPYGAVALAAFRGREAPAAHLLQTATDDAERRGEGRALSFIGWTEAVLYNSLGRYEEALAAAQRASEDSPAVQFADWALVDSRGGAAQRGTRARAVARGQAALRRPRGEYQVPPRSCAGSAAVIPDVFMTGWYDARPAAALPVRPVSPCLPQRTATSRPTTRVTS